jgi:hypothetical protein
MVSMLIISYQVLRMRNADLGRESTTEEVRRVVDRGEESK